MNRIYVDLDGVLADFNAEPNAVERFPIERGFFRKLKPITDNIEAIKGLLTYQKREVYIISASPNLQADSDKVLWLRNNMPWFPMENVIICRNGEVKALYAKDIKNSVLLDDYGKNCREWELLGGQSIKIETKRQIMDLLISGQL